MMEELPITNTVTFTRGQHALDLCMPRDVPVLLMKCKSKANE